MADHHAPVRTCIGCRAKALQRELRRWVLATDDDGRARVVPDDRRELPGRGAWLHDDPECRQLAVRRRAFRRALRIAGDAEVDIVDPDGTDQHEDGTGQHVASPLRHTEEADRR